jgi:hypothetical protein
MTQTLTGTPAFCGQLTTRVDAYDVRRTLPTPMTALRLAGGQRTLYSSQEAMRFGPRAYTRQQGAAIQAAASARAELPEQPFPLDD